MRINSTFTKLTIILGSLCAISACQSTIEGMGDAMGNLTGKSIHNSFDGKYISQPQVAEYKQREDEFSGTEGVISYSGKDIPKQQIRQSHVVHSPRLKKYLDGILDNLMAQWDGSPVNVQIQVVHSQSFAPYADSFGMISIPIGTLNNVESEDELAILIAHEVSHILMRHHERDAVVQDNKENVNMLASAIVMANVAKDTSFVKQGKSRTLEYNPSEQGSDNISKAMVYNAVIQTVSDSVWNTAWKRTQEDEADLLGFDLAIAAGYSPRAHSHVLERLENFQGKQEGMLSAFWEKQQEALTGAFKAGDLGGISQQFNAFLVEGLSTSLSTAADYFQKRHMAPDVREENIKSYALRVYRDEVRRKVDRQKWNEVKEVSEVATVLSSYRVAFEASNALSAGDIDTAMSLARESQTSITKNHPYMRELMYNIRMAKGDSIKAMQNLDLIERWQDASPSLVEIRVERLMKQQKFEDALAAIESAENTFGNESLFILQKSIALSNTGNNEEALSTLDKCEKYDEFKLSCQSLRERIT